jgi:hypothetical protein
MITWLIYRKREEVSIKRVWKFQLLISSTPRDVRNFLRLFRGAHKKYLTGYVAVCELRRNHKHISPKFIALN